LTKIQWWLWEEKLIELRIQRLYHGNLPMDSSTTPSTSNKCNSLTATPMMLKFWENLPHLPN